MKFTRKPIQVDAVQFRESDDEDSWPKCVQTDAFAIPFIRYQGQSMPIEDGDWIVTEPLGQPFPVRAAKFPTLYEKTK